MRNIMHVESGGRAWERGYARMAAVKVNLALSVIV